MHVNKISATAESSFDFNVIISNNQQSSQPGLTTESTTAHYFGILDCC